MYLAGAFKKLNEQVFQSRIVSDFSLCFVVLLVFLWLSGRALR